MKKLFVIYILSGLFLTAQAQVTFLKYPVPIGTDNDNYRLVADYYSEKQILFPVKTSGEVYVKNNTGSNFNVIDTGLYITAFYANNGDLYLVENADTSGYEPHLYKSANNGSSFTEITGVEGRVFQRDQYGNLFYSVNGGFAFSIDDGANFTTVNTPRTVFSVARNTLGSLFFLADSTKLFSSINNGNTWQDISKNYIGNPFLEHHIWAVDDTIYFQTASNFSYTTVAGAQYTTILPISATSIITNVHVSPDNAFFCVSAYGFFNTNTPAVGYWNNLNNTIGSPQQTIYNNFIAVTDSQMYFITDTGYVYSPRTANVTGINEFESTINRVSVFPNPAKQNLQVTSEGYKGEFKLYNLQGKMVLTKFITSAVQNITINMFDPGIYIWRLNSSHGKLIILE